MRILMAALLAVSILIGTKLFIDASQPKPLVRNFTPESIASGVFELELVPMFDVEPDEFALDAEQATSLSVSLLGETIFSESDSAGRGEPIVVSDVQGLVEGRNELYVRATPSPDSTDAVHAMRVRVLRDGLVLAEEWLSAERGDEVAGPVRLKVIAHHSSEQLN